MLNTCTYCDLVSLQRSRVENDVKRSFRDTSPDKELSFVLIFEVTKFSSQ